MRRNVVASPGDTLPPVCGRAGGSRSNRCAVEGHGGVHSNQFMFGASVGLRKADTGVSYVVRRWNVLLAWSFVWSPLGSSCAAGSETDGVAREDFPRLFAEAYCPNVLACSCATPPYETPEVCVSRVARVVAAGLELEATAGLEFDERCAEELVAAAGDLSCADTSPEPRCDGCRLIHGSLPVGSDCAITAEGFDSCDQGLVCRGQPDLTLACDDPCVEYPLGLGDVCLIGGYQIPAGTCPANSYCAVGDTNRCEPWGGPGQTCGGAEPPCNPETLYCPVIDAEPACTVQRGLGETCYADPYCSAEAYCDTIGGPVGQCAPLPGSGQPCESGRCAPGLVCAATDLCSAPEPSQCSEYASG